MRIICGLVAVSMLVVLVQPAFAVCIIRGGAKNCTRDPNAPKYGNSAAAFQKDAVTENPGANGPTTVLRASGPTSAAWILTPQTTKGGLVLGSANVAVFTCGSGTIC